MSLLMPLLLLQGAYFAHVVFCYFVFLTGAGAFVSRVVPSFKWTHMWFGRWARRPPARDCFIRNQQQDVAVGEAVHSKSAALQRPVQCILSPHFVA
jgi:hypothetical protein